MTTRHSGYLVTLEKDKREDDAEYILNAIRMIKGVISVKPVVADPLGEQIASDRLKDKITREMFQVIKDA